MNFPIFADCLLTSADTCALQNLGGAQFSGEELVDRVGGEAQAAERKVILKRLFRGSLKPIDLEPRAITFAEEMTSIFLRSPRLIWEGQASRNFSQDRLYNLCFRECLDGGQSIMQIDAALDKTGCVLHATLRELRVTGGVSTEISQIALFPGLKVSPMSEIIPADIADDFFDVVKEDIAVRLLDHVVGVFAAKDQKRSL